LKQKDYLK